MPSKPIPINEAKNHLTSLVKQVVRKGEIVTISVHGRPLANLTPYVLVPEQPRPARPVPVRVKLSSGPSLSDVLDEQREDRL